MNVRQALTSTDAITFTHLFRDMWAHRRYLGYAFDTAVAEAPNWELNDKHWKAAEFLHSLGSNLQRAITTDIQ